MGRFGFVLYLIFIASWFLRFAARFPVLGVVRFDLVLVVLIFGIYVLTADKKTIKGLENPCYKRMIVLVIVILAITPLAEFPGSVVKFGLANYIKAIVFFFFTVWFVQTEKRLKVLVGTFVFCQSFRVLEPLYLHLTQGYWGASAFMGYQEFMDRLSGAPYDTINPNGLAFVILTILPYLLYLYQENIYWKAAAFTVGPCSIYALYLTGSRSGMLGLLVILIVFVLQSKHKIVLSMLFVTVALLGMSKMEGNFKDRYLSIVSSSSANSSTAQGRIDGVLRDFSVGLRKPIFGHGLGTSGEANVNFGTGDGKRSHNIYTETFQEIGIIGLCVFLSLIVLVFKNLSKSIHDRDKSFIVSLKHSLRISVLMNVFFGLASYGLSGYVWYFLAALSLLVSEHLKEGQLEKENSSHNPLASRRDTHIRSVRVS